MKLFPILIMLFLCISFSSAIKVSPTQQSLDIIQYETNCTNIWILPEANYSIYSKWSREGSGDLTKYILNAEDIRLRFEYSYISKGDYKVCFRPNRGGHFSGIIYFYDEINRVEIGSWIELDVEQIDTIESISLLTGKTVKTVRENNIDIWFVFLFLLIVCIFLATRTFLKKN